MASPERRIIYNRSGNLATITELDQDKADKFMKVADMRRDIEIVDSDVPPEKDVVAVSSDTLAFRAIEPIRRLAQISFKPKPFYTLTHDLDLFTVKIHERQIDDKIRSGNYTDCEDYNKLFLAALNKTTKSAILEVLFQEKLGWDDQKENYVFHLGQSAFSPLFIALLEYQNMLPAVMNGYEQTLIIPFFLATNVIGNGLSDYVSWQVQFFQYLAGIDKPFISPTFALRDGINLLLPLIPIDKYLVGKRFLNGDGQPLIIPRNSS